MNTKTGSTLSHSESLPEFFGGIHFVHFIHLMHDDASAGIEEYEGGKLYHFRDNVSGDEVDSIIEFKDGNYAAFEIKLSDGSIQEAMDSLKTFYMHADKKPVFMCVIVGHLETVMCDPLSGIYVNDNDIKLITLLTNLI